ncbi:MAG: ATP-binding cassette domain-containing protein, partial [Bacteroidales bacterium]|nr:ATP-binding cassette domain-containing protein [Bacteroidales bacterium]
MDVVPKGSAPNDVVLKGNSIEIRDVKFSYGDSILDFGNHKIDKGEYVGFCGYSGVGKTTLFNIILGFLQPQQGQVLIDGKPLTKENRNGWLKNIGYVPQEVFIFNGSLAENIALGYKEIDMGRVAQVLEMVSLSSWCKTLQEGMHSKLGEG